MSEVYIGDNKRRKSIILAEKSLFKAYEHARINLDAAINKIIDENNGRWIDFFNKLGPISKRRHQLELLPGIGNKHMWNILRGRRSFLKALRILL